jgi:atpD: ATP synthase F1, beta subunit
LLKS